MAEPELDVAGIPDLSGLTLRDLQVRAPYDVEQVVRRLLGDASGDVPVAAFNSMI